MDTADLIARGRHLWAKSAEEPPGHSLLAHMLDVGLVAEEMLSRRPGPLTRVLAADLGIAEHEAVRLAVVLAALHDLGKATPVFQAKWVDGAPREALTPQRMVDVPHGRASAVFLRALLREAGFRRSATGLANAVAIHHGMRMTVAGMSDERLDPRSLGTGAWERWRQALWEDVQEALGTLTPPERTCNLTGRAWALLAGLTSVADWIGSSLSFVGVVEDPKAYVRARADAVRERLEEVGWPDGTDWTTERKGAPFATWFAGPDQRFEARPLQDTVAETAQGLAPPFLLVIEAPMGEGKTEAALFTAGSHPDRGVYVGLPTQATSDAMHARLESFIRRNATRPVHVALAHSAASDTRHLRSPSAFDAEGAVTEADVEDWYSSTKRALLAEAGAGTVDQALLAVLPVRHFFVRLWGLAQKVVVLDEVHAYETYTSTLMAELLRWLAAFGAPVVLMSATLPSETRRQLVTAYAEGASMPSPSEYDATYPRITALDASGFKLKHFPASQRRRVVLRPAPHDTEALATAAVEAASGGASVAVILNTVERAQQVFLACRGDGAQVALLHSRFPLEHRKRLESELIRRYGPGSADPERGGIVVATQVLEQSLDVDFDVMFTDLAPVDLVLQRVGRLHRHAGRPRPTEAAEANLFVAGLFSEDRSTPHPNALDTVYHPYVMWRTWAALEAKGSLTLPDDIDPLVQLVYSETAIQGLEAHEDAVEEARRSLDQLRLAQRQAALNWSLDRPGEPASQSWGEPGVEEDEQRDYALKLSTRLGEDSVTVAPVVLGTQGWTVYGTDAITPASGTRATDAFVNACLERQLRVSSKNLVERLRRQQVPSWWRRSGPLRGMLPLPLAPDGLYVEDDRVRLDDVLGLVVGRRE